MKKVLLALFVICSFKGSAQTQIYSASGYLCRDSLQADSIISGLNFQLGIGLDTNNVTKTYTSASIDSNGVWYIPHDSTIHAFMKRDPDIIWIKATKN